jgi:hypothetical protein
MNSSDVCYYLLRDNYSPLLAGASKNKQLVISTFDDKQSHDTVTGYLFFSLSDLQDLVCASSLICPTSLIVP